GDFDRALALKENVRRKMDEQFNFVTYMQSLAFSAWSYSYTGRWDEAVEDGQKALSAAEEFSDNSLISLAALPILTAYVLKGDVHRGIEYGELAVEKAPTPFDKALTHLFLGWAWCRAGEPSKGIDAMASADQIARTGGNIPFNIITLWYLADGYRLAGQYDKSRQTGKELLELTEHCGSRPFQGISHLLTGEIAVKTNPDQAEAWLRQSISIFRETKMENFLALAYAGYGRLHKLQGNVEQAREYLTKALEILERLGTLIEPEKVREELAGLSGC
ncbi:MAG: tetratricopeptide repeat protein, partial [Deltaproteobacteria bacterium]|nr:tetratricopeptide repeat protein [Deltaproteobacteria bacterium]